MTSCRGAGREKPVSLISRRVGLCLARDSPAMCLLAGSDTRGLLRASVLLQRIVAGSSRQHQAAACDKNARSPYQGRASETQQSGTAVFN